MFEGTPAARLPMKPSRTRSEYLEPARAVLPWPIDALSLWLLQRAGLGIRSELQARVCGMFQRLSKEYDGTGIGLALVKKVAERMGGQVGLESDGDGGCRFWIELKDVRNHGRAA